MYLSFTQTVVYYIYKTYKNVVYIDIKCSFNANYLSMIIYEMHTNFIQILQCNDTYF